MNLNVFRTILVTDLQHNSVRIHTHNSLFITKIALNYKDKVFPDGECLHALIKYGAWRITCIPIKPRNIIHINCDLGFCDECTE